MGTITSGIGLISGINTAQLIDQLLALEARPKQLVEQRNIVLTSQQVALQEINAKLLVMKLSASGFVDNKVFQTTTATSSDDTVLGISSGSSTIPGSYDFTVDRLVTTQQVITDGFADQDITPLAPAGGTLTFEFGAGRLDTNTQLSQLNSSSGIQRGKIRITDRTGASAVVDLSKALTVDDVLQEINNTSGINVVASVSGDAFQIDDATGATTTSLSVSDVAASGTSASLGLNTAAVGNTLTGLAVNVVGDDTLLSTLNDGNGVRVLTVQDDLQVLRQDGTTFDVDLAGVVDLGGVIDAINTASGGDVTASVSPAGSSLQLVDTSTDNGFTLTVTALNGSNAAADLGILTTDTDGDGTLDGDRVIASLNSKLIKNLNGGTGVNLGQISITNRAGTATAIDLSSAQNIDDVISLINGSGALVTASLNASGNGFLLADQTGSSASDLIITDVTGTAGTDLGLAGTFTADTVDSGNLQLRYISESTRLSSFNGGRGITSGKFTITDSSGASAEVDLTQGNEVTVQDVLDEINSRGLSINARVNDNGDGILIEDTGLGTVALTIAEAGSTTAKDLGILGVADNPGDDIDGSFETTVTITATDTLDGIVQSINNAGIAVTATVINDGSIANPFRLSLLSKDAGGAGAFLFDDGGLGLGASTLVQAQDAVTFFGSSDPAKAIAITSPTNTLNAVIPGATVDLKNTSNSPVRVTITRDDSAITDAVKSFVDQFNSVISALDSHDSFNPDTEQRGLLLGDPTVARVRSSLFRIANGRNTDLTSQFTTLAQIGIRVGSGAKLNFDQTKFANALATDFDAVQQLFTFKETKTDPETNEITVTAAGIGVRFDEVLDNLTDSISGTLKSRLDSITKQIDAGNDRIDLLDTQLDAKRARLEAQFVAMERALAQLQSQSSALSAFQPVTI